MQQVKLDRIDRHILHDLQADGRITTVELARRAGISAPPCLRRVRALEEAGYIRGYHADLEPKALGFNVTVFAQVGLSSQAEPDLEAFEDLVRQWPNVRECHMLAGETDFLLKIVAEDWDAYQRFLTTHVDHRLQRQPRQIGAVHPRHQVRTGRSHRLGRARRRRGALTRPARLRYSGP